jgi:hypothetical protein
MSERTGRKWEQGLLPSQARPPRSWRTRPDPFAGVWASEIEPCVTGRALGRPIRSQSSAEDSADDRPKVKKRPSKKPTTGASAARLAAAFST